MSTYNVNLIATSLDGNMDDPEIKVLTDHISDTDIHLSTTYQTFLSELYANGGSTDVTVTVDDVEGLTEALADKVSVDTLDDYTTTEVMTTLLSAKADTTALSDYYTKDELDGLIAGTFNFQGSCTEEELSDKDMTTGHVWQVGDKEYACNGTDWVELGFNIDLSGYATTESVTTLSGTVSGHTTSITSISTEVTELTSDVTEHTSDEDIHITAAERTTWTAKADASSVYTKSETDALIPDVSSYITVAVDNLTNYTTTTDMNTALAAKADVTAIPDTSSYITSSVDDLTNYYTKTAVDALIPDVSDFITIDDVPATDLTSYVTTTTLSTTLEGYASSSVATDLNTHTSNTDIHVTTTDKATWNGKADADHTHDTYVTADSLTSTLAGYSVSTHNHDTTYAAIGLATDVSTLSSSLTTHTSDEVVHITAAERTSWSAKADTTDIPDITGLAVAADMTTALAGKVDVVEGSGLVAEATVTQISTNATDIATLNTTVSGHTTSISSINSSITSIESDITAINESIGSGSSSSGAGNSVIISTDTTVTLETGCTYYVTGGVLTGTLPTASTGATIHIYVTYTPESEGSAVSISVPSDVTTTVTEYATGHLVLVYDATNSAWQHVDLG